jgi:penicillin amidase
MTSVVNNQASGATFRIIADLSDWDRAVGTNAPGQSGDPENPHYSDLFKMWAEGRYFPVYFSRPKIQSVAEKTTILQPVRHPGSLSGFSFSFQRPRFPSIQKKR